jgi:hydroxyacylglutathione hydrolase
VNENAKKQVTIIYSNLVTLNAIQIMLKIRSFTFNAFQENTYVVFDETNEAVIIDPGCYSKEEMQQLDGFIESSGLSIKYLLNTHCHIDHVLGNNHVKEKYNVPFLIHQKDLPVLKAVKSYASNYGFPLYSEALPDGFVTEGDKIEFGASSLEVIFLPGHAPGHVGFYNLGEKILLSGDVLFSGSIGRTDLPGGDFNTLIESIHQKLFVLPADVAVYSGHGRPTTIGKEKVSNPFCAVEN